MNIWIIGGGKFGRQAAMALHGKVENPNIIVIDKQQRAVFAEKIAQVLDEGIEWFFREFTPNGTVDMIIPALPVHLAAEWLKMKLLEAKMHVSSVNIPEQILHQLPNLYSQSGSQCVISHADFLCPAHCSEPENICSYTKKRRPEPLYQVIEKTVRPYFIPLVLQSRQFAPGVGGYFPRDLWGLLDEALLHPGKPLLVGTACKCHGVMGALSFVEK